MRKLLIGALVALAIPGTALAAKPAAKSVKSPAKACKALRAEMGVATFKAANKNLGKCVSKHQKKATRTPEALETETNAAQDCKQQRTEMGAVDFATLYGTNANKRNAFGKCVSKLSSEDDDEDESGEETENENENEPAEQPAEQS